MAKKENIKYSKVQELVDAWKLENPLPEGARYSFSQLCELDQRICGYIAEVKGSGSFQAVYYSYHSIRWILQYLDPTFNFTSRVVDHSVNVYNAKVPCGLDNQGTQAFNNITFQLNNVQQVLGLSVEISFTSSILPICNNVTQLYVMDAKYQAITSGITSRDIDKTTQRCLVKAIAENTGLGYLAWLKPSYVMDAINTVAQEDKIGIFEDNGLPETINAPTTPTPMAMPAPAINVGTTGQLAKVSAPKLPSKKTTKKATETPEVPVAPAVEAPVPTPTIPVVAPVPVEAPVEAPVVAPVPPVQAEPQQAQTPPIINFDAPSNIIANNVPPVAPAPAPAKPQNTNYNDLFLSYIQTNGDPFIQFTSNYCLENNITDLTMLTPEQKEIIINKFESTKK